MNDAPRGWSGRDAGPEIEDLPSPGRSSAPGPIPPAAVASVGGQAATAPARSSLAGPHRPRYGEGALISCDNLVKIFKVADLEVVALQGLDLLVNKGEMIAIVGASGSGK